MPDTDRHVVTLSDLRTVRDFSIVPDAATREAIAGRLGLDGLRKLRFEGRLSPEGARDWVLEADLGATVVQPCVVTLAPVTTRIDEAVTRRYLADYTEPEGDTEVEMPEDDTAEPLPRALNLDLVMEEALALAAPAFPRADGVELGEAAFTEPGRKPMSDDDAKPFAGLRDKLAGGSSDDS